MTLRNWLSNRRCELMEFEHHISELDQSAGECDPETWAKYCRLWVRLRRQKDV